MKHTILALLLLLWSATVHGQDPLSPGISSASWDVFLRLGPDNAKETRIVFVDLLTGEATETVASGEGHTLIDAAVLYFDTAERKVRLVKPDGVIRDHPFIAVNASDSRIDWVVDDYGGKVAWSISRTNDTGALTTNLMVADAAGAEIRELLVYGPRPGIRLIPLAFDSSGSALYVEVHADGTEDVNAYTRRSGLFALDFGGQNVATRPLSGERACFCAVGFGGARWLQLVAREGTGGGELEIHDISNGTTRRIPPVSLGEYKEAGNILTSPDGKLAVYALSRVTGFAGGQQEINTVMVLADLESARQMVVNYPMTALAQPLRWTEDNSAVLFTQVGSGATWKMQISDGSTVKVADGVYLGTIGGVSGRR